MSKNTKIALVVFAATMLAPSGGATAQEMHVEGVTGFTGTGGPSTLVASGEPTITCESTDVSNGVVNAGGTTGSMELGFTGCHAIVLGFTVKCHTTGSAADNRINTAGTFHAVDLQFHTYGFLLTVSTTESICAGISNTHIEGNAVIGTKASPECGGFGGTTLTLSFSATGSTQNHIAYTGVNYDLKTKTSGGSSLTAGLNSTITLTAAGGNKFFLNCTG